MPEWAIVSDGGDALRVGTGTTGSRSGFRPPVGRRAAASGSRTARTQEGSNGLRRVLSVLRSPLVRRAAEPRGQQQCFRPRDRQQASTQTAAAGSSGCCQAYGLLSLAGQPHCWDNSSASGSGDRSPGLSLPLCRAATLLEATGRRSGFLPPVGRRAAAGRPQGSPAHWRGATPATAFRKPSPRKKNTGRVCGSPLRALFRAWLAGQPRRWRRPDGALAFALPVGQRRLAAPRTARLGWSRGPGALASSAPAARHKHELAVAGLWNS